METYNPETGDLHTSGSFIPIVLIHPPFNQINMFSVKQPVSLVSCFVG